jgi:Tol biopolymer transport system component
LVDRREAETSRAEADPHGGEPKRFSLLKTALAAAVVFILLGTLFYFRERFLPTKANARGDLTILRLTNGVAPNGATISPDGNYFVYYEADSGISHFWLQQTGGSSRVEIIPPTEKIIYGATFSPDNQFVYYFAGDQPGETASLYRVMTLGGAPTKILDDISSPVSFSPDGREMVFRRWNPKTSESYLIIASADGSNQRVLLASTAEQGVLAAPAWSPDGNLIAFAAVKTEQSQLASCWISAINLRTNAVETISPEKWDTCYRIAWTRDGRGLVFIGTKFKEGYSTRRDQVYYLSYPSGEARRLTSDGNRYDVNSLGVTDAGEILAVPFDRTSQIWQLNGDGDARAAAQITNGWADGRAGIAPLPDGRVGYIARTGDNLNVWVTNADGTNQKQLTYDPSAIEELRASPDGRFFTFSDSTTATIRFFRWTRTARTCAS